MELIGFIPNRLEDSPGDTYVIRLAGRTIQVEAWWSRFGGGVNAYVDGVPVERLPESGFDYDAFDRLRARFDRRYFADERHVELHRLHARLIDDALRWVRSDAAGSRRPTC